MGASKIILADRDMEYGRALARAVSNLHNEFDITIAQFEIQGQEMLDSSIELHNYDLILIGGYSDEFTEAIRDKTSKGRRIVILTDHISENLVKQSEADESHFWYLFKYTDVSLIVSDLNFLIGSLTGKKSLLKKSSAPEFIGFHSISGGAGKTVISLGASRELVRYHDKKVLYLSFEDIPTTELLIKNHSQNRNIGDYLYFLFEKRNDHLCSRLESFTVTDEFGVETFYPTGGRNDLNELTQEELVQFLKVISDSCRYDYIVFDLKSDLSEETLFLMNLCSRIILVQKDDPVSGFKSGKLEAYLKQEARKFSGRCILAVNKTSSPEPVHEENEICVFKSLKKIYIEKDDNSFQFGWNHLSIDISHTFGVGVKKIADEILSPDTRQQKEGL